MEFLEVSEFKLRSRYYVHFRNNIFGKSMNLIIPQLSVKSYHSKDSFGIK